MMPSYTVTRSINWRSLVAYWILGLCNNYGYVVMLSAADDILTSLNDRFDEIHRSTSNSNATYYDDHIGRECNIMSTGVILLADVIPSLCVKLISPFLPLFVNLRLCLVIMASVTSFILVGIAHSPWVTIVGVGLTSFASGLGEATLLPYTVFFHDRNVVLCWSSGTGGAGIFGSITYASFIAIGISSSMTLFILTLVPLAMAASFWLLLEHPQILYEKRNVDTVRGIQASSVDLNFGVNPGKADLNDVPLAISSQSFWYKLKYMPRVVPFVVPIFFVYLFEYYINQGLFELVYFKGTFLDQHSQYRWYQVLYQIGVFVSRSSITFVQIDAVWFLSVLQGINAVYLTADAIYSITPHMSLMFALILWEGLLGGGAYVNTFYKVQRQVRPEDREFATAVTTIGDSVGISVAGFLAIPVHNRICSLPMY